LQTQKLYPEAIAVLPKIIEIKYPIEIQEFKCSKTHAPGQTSKAIFLLRNFCSKVIGGPEGRKC